jgi:hypothetical protein
MAEGVNTGGTKRFVYEKSEKRELNEHEKEGLDVAYARAAIRKEKERRKKMIKWISIALGIIVFIILGIIIFR